MFPSREVYKIHKISQNFLSSIDDRLIDINRLIDIDWHG